MSKDYGAVIAQSGTAVRYAEDYQKILDTRWRPVGIASVHPVDFRADINAGLYKLFDHNLGYIPAMDAPRQTDYLNPFSQSSPIGSSLFVADDTSVYLIKYFGLTPLIKGNIYLYDYAINEPYDTQYKGTSLARVSKSDYGMQIEGNNTWATAHLGDGDNLGYAVNTNVKTLSLAKVDTVQFDTTVTTNFTINYDIPYPPLVKVSRKVLTGDILIGFNNPVVVPKDSYSALSMADNSAYFNSGTIGQSTVYVSGTAGLKLVTFAYVIFRDPSEIAQ